MVINDTRELKEKKTLTILLGTAIISEKSHSEIGYGLGSTFLQPFTHPRPTVANARLPPQLRCRRCLRRARPPHDLSYGCSWVPIPFPSRFFYSLFLSLHLHVPALSTTAQHRRRHPSTRRCLFNSSSTGGAACSRSGQEFPTGF
ncbi:unnamed protein product [Citrullus colocynthis]|uniref:Uncharacterized protein n=1 Tax=Citrullus colocynthis TaxID=252529 RepID=A0ABP0YKK9_9ROSI